MVKKNGIGKKVVGAAVSMAMMVTAVPAMTSLACENEPLISAASPVEARHFAATQEELGNRLIEVINFYYESESVIPADYRATCITIFNNISLTCRDPRATTQRIRCAAAQIEEVYDNIANYVAQYENEAYVKSEALMRLYDRLAEMVEFEVAFYDDFKAATDMEVFDSWVAFGVEVYFNNDGYTADDINDLSDILDAYFNEVINAVDAYTQPEEIAPDYGMNLDEDTDDGLVIEHPDDFTISPDFQIDPQDSFTIDPEQIEDVAPDYGMDLDDEDIDDEDIDDEDLDDEDIDNDDIVETEPVAEAAAEETIAEEPVIAEAPAAETSAPATRVAGASRSLISDRNALAQQVVDRLYTNALNRTADAAGRTYWVNVILEGNGNVDKVITGFLNSAEFNARDLNDDEFVALLYKVILNRAPSASEQAIWTNALSNGASRRTVINAFVDSTEFDSTCEAHAL